MKKRFKKKLTFKKIIPFLIFILGLCVIFYPYLGKSVKENFFQPKKQSKISDILIYPNSIEKHSTQTENRLTINYQTNPGVSYHQVISFYLENLPKLGWRLTSSSETEANFEKGTKKIRIWILYVQEKTDQGVDYIIDYSPLQESPPII